MSDDICKAMAQGMIGGAIGAVVLIAYVFATGQTFGQRCAKMHPNGDDLTIRRCVYDLKHEDRP
jgi:hypothetical protein